MTWLDYIVTIAAPHSRYNAQQWFRYLRKDIEKDISGEQIDELYNNSALSAFQRISLKTLCHPDVKLALKRVFAFFQYYT